MTDRAALPAGSLQGRRILVVEDDFLLAMTMMDILQHAGAEVEGPIGWVEEAVAFVETHQGKLDGAVRDIDLHGEKSYPVADALAANAINFVFATGYDGSIIEDGYRHNLHCEKPFNTPVLLATLERCLALPATL